MPSKSSACGTAEKRTAESFPGSHRAAHLNKLEQILDKHWTDTEQMPNAKTRPAPVLS